jgi:hypothetical protein
MLEVDSGPESPPAGVGHFKTLLMANRGVNNPNFVIEITMFL